MMVARAAIHITFWLWARGELMAVYVTLSVAGVLATLPLLQTRASRSIWSVLIKRTSLFVGIGSSDCRDCVVVVYEKFRWWEDGVDVF
jgi:hypothetical protein